ncbi:FAD:protein FMN transferase [Chitinivibrio alkaliphilus]|nr:FAD:protein FMN transferase [Chitinivibrio alkaliphilus]
MFLSGCTNHDTTPEEHHRRFWKFSTHIDITLTSPTPPDDTLWDGVTQLLNRYNRRYSPMDTLSWVWQVNHRTSDTVIVDEELFDMVQQAQWGHKVLGGTFDITTAPLRHYWNTPQKSGLPNLHSAQTKEALPQLLRYTGMEHLTTIAPDTLIFSHDKSTLDVGGIAKSYVIKALKTYLLEEDIPRFIISIGGDLYLHDTTDTPFILGVQHPRKTGAVLCTLHVATGSVVTSGDYERYRRDAKGHRIHHILNPKTGYPTEENQSVTLIGNNPVTTDILSTGLLAHPVAQAEKILSALPDITAIIVDRAATVHTIQGPQSPDIRCRD